MRRDCTSKNFASAIIYIFAFEGILPFAFFPKIEKQMFFFTNPWISQEPQYFFLFSPKSGRWGARSAFYWALGSALVGFSEAKPYAPARGIARSRREGTISGKRCPKIFVSWVPGVAPPRARGAEPRRAVQEPLGHFGWSYPSKAAVFPSEAADREISTRRARLWQKMSQNLRFTGTRCRAAARARRRTTPSCAGTFGAFGVELPVESRRVPV